MTQLDLISELMIWEPPVYLFGGFAEDAVLYGKVSRPHQDVDVLIWLDQLAMRIEQARALGFHSFEVRFEAAPGHPLAVGAQSHRGLDLEFCIGERDTQGRAFFYRPSSTGLQRCWFPPDALSYPIQELEGLPVRTVSPLTLYQVRTALADVFGGLRPKDRQIQAALRERFFAGLTDADLAPNVEPIGDC
ncbi:MAG: hypothetical protein ACOYYF_03985 [Chloroflexota bacterium]